MRSCLFSDARLVGLVVTIISALSLGGALISQYMFGLDPCVLCIYQRWPHAITILLGLTGGYMALRHHPKRAAMILALCAPVYLIGAAIAFYHVGVEQHWWKSALEACSVDFSSTSLLEQIQSTKAARCDVIPFQLFGISMAGYNGLISFGMGIYTLIGAIMVTRRANGF